MRTNTHILLLILMISLSVFSGLQAQNEITPRDLIHERIDVHAQRSLYRLLTYGNEFEQTVAADLWNDTQLDSLEGIYVVDQGVPAMRARDIGIGWWQIIPKGRPMVVMDKPANRAPLVALAKRILPYDKQVDEALVQAWWDILAIDLQRKIPNKPTIPNKELPEIIPIPEIPNQAEIESQIKEWANRLGWSSQTEEIVKQHLVGK